MFGSGLRGETAAFGDGLKEQRRCINRSCFLFFLVLVFLFLSSQHCCTVAATDTRCGGAGGGGRRRRGGGVGVGAAGWC